MNTVNNSTNSALDPIRSWLRGKHPEMEINEDLDLIENRVIDSLQFTELVLLLESVSQRRIDMETLTVDHFRTLRAIEVNFLKGAAR